MKRVVTSLLVIALVGGIQTSAEAQIRLAPEIAIAEDVDFGIGVHAFFPVASSFEVSTYFDYFFPGGSVNYSELGGVAYYVFRTVSPSVVPKVGGGFTIGFISVDSDIANDPSATEVGMSLLGGIDFPMNSITPYIEGGGNLTSELPQWFIRGGVGFALGG